MYRIVVTGYRKHNPELRKAKERDYVRIQRDMLRDPEINLMDLPSRMIYIALVLRADEGVWEGDDRELRYEAGIRSNRFNVALSLSRLVRERLIEVTSAQALPLAPVAGQKRRRAPISTSIRFMVFDRDGFACRYCGARPPDVVLVLDHIQALANGGKDDPGNYATACEPCNQGKADGELTAPPPPPASLNHPETSPNDSTENLNQESRLRNDLENAAIQQPGETTSIAHIVSNQDRERERVITPHPPKGGAGDPESFDREVWPARPRREPHPNPRGAARKSYLRALAVARQEGLTAADLLAALRRYAAHCQRQAILGTASVQQLATFFGPAKETWRQYLEEQPAPSMPGANRNGTTQPPPPPWPAGLAAPEDAWDELRQAIRDGVPERIPAFSNPAIRQVARQLGWRELCELSARELHFRRADFERAYRREVAAAEAGRQPQPEAGSAVVPFERRAV